MASLLGAESVSDSNGDSTGHLQSMTITVTVIVVTVANIHGALTKAGHSWGPHGLVCHLHKHPWWSWKGKLGLREMT